VENILLDCVLVIRTWHYNSTALAILTVYILSQRTGFVELTSSVSLEL
jgi:hypothetical protein